MQNDTSDDYGRFERRQLAKDMDRRCSETLTIGGGTAEKLINDLCHRNIVSVVPDEQLFVHELTGTAFDDHRGLVYFHKGWEAALNDSK